MVINLTKLGLTTESTFAEIQTALTNVVVFSEEEVKTRTDSAAAGARKAEKDILMKQFKKNALTEDEMEEYKTFKSDAKTKSLKGDATLSRFEPEDFELITSKYSTELALAPDSDEYKAAIKEISSKYGKRMNNKVPKKVAKEVQTKTKTSEEIAAEKEAAEAKANEPYVPGSLNLFSKVNSSDEE